MAAVPHGFMVLDAHTLVRVADIVAVSEHEYRGDDDNVYTRTTVHMQGTHNFTIPGDATDVVLLIAQNRDDVRVDSGS